MTLFSKKTKKPQSLKEADGTNLNITQYHEVPTVLFHHIFSLDWTERAFFNLIF